MTGRTYRLWDYTPSHAQLLVRALADSDHPSNDDLVFAGVRHIQMPEAIVDARVREGDSQEFSPSRQPSAGFFAEDVRVFVVEGSDPDGHPVRGFVVAKSYKRETNERSSFDSSLRHSISALPSGDAFERQVVAALARIPNAEVSFLEGSGIDVVLKTSEGTLVAVEVKQLRGRPVPRAIRGIVTQLVVAMGRMPPTAHAIVILSGAAPSFVHELRDHLVTALGGRATAIEWRPEDGSHPLEEAIRALAA